MSVNRPWRRVAALAAVLLAILLALPLAVTPGLRGRLTAALGERFDSKVELASLRVSALPRIRIAGDKVVLRHKGRTDVPPLITIRSFSAEANVLGLIGRPLRLARVHLDGLEVNVPPGGMSIDDEDDADDHQPNEDRDASDDEGDVDSGAAPGDGLGGDDGEGESSASAGEAGDVPESPLIVDHLVSEQAVVRILRSSPEKKPRLFEIAHLSMEDTGANTPWAFTATLTNPTPPGAIRAQGTFGPWNAERPASTAMDAKYEFRDADLGAFDGIQGILHSAGAFQGVLERIEVVGRTNVADFALKDVGHPVPLTTTFHAIVDGTNGNTWLEPVEARLSSSPILATGGVIERKGEDDRSVVLDVVMAGARIEDVLRLAVKSSVPPLTGGLNLKTKFLLPPGEADEMDRLQLDGSFEIAAARFRTGDVQEKVDELSHKARDADGEPDRIASDFTGRFVMRAGVIHFSKVTFTVPGARVDVAGRYTLRTEALDFRGTVRLEAKLSEMTSGLKSFLLKLVDPLLRRKDVTVIPVTIRGTAEKPRFGLDVRRAFTPD